MAKSKKRRAELLNQPGYITMRRSHVTRAPTEPTAVAPWSMPSAALWRMALDRAASLVQMVCEQMQAYSDGRSEDWHAGQSAGFFHENLEQLNELQEQLDDLRSNF